MSESITAALWATAIGLGMVVLFFPVWRVIARRSPELATEGHPELLDEIDRDRPMHPGEPDTNVRRFDS